VWDIQKNNKYYFAITCNDGGFLESQEKVMEDVTVIASTRNIQCNENSPLKVMGKARKNHYIQEVCLSQVFSHYGHLSTGEV
jgi:hypothetical protein